MIKVKALHSKSLMLMVIFATNDITINIKDGAPEFISPNDEDQIRGSDGHGLATTDTISFDVAEHESGILVGKVAAFDPDTRYDHLYP